ncbi:DUF2797 domain-containing protein [Candidatus Heimdallarchaeota archaeon]|nr:MAG: DUF2797 domain-containing protein [Candidatus Heimdallarchaeota archaeon]
MKVEMLLKEHLIAAKWDPSTPPYSFLVLRNLETSLDKTYRKYLSPGDEFHLKISEERICIGHSINKQEYYLCNKQVDQQYNRCYNCEQQDFERCFLFCDASKPFGNCTQNPQAYEYCKTYPCSVYLALIANDIKVGVSFNPLKRWINQGADLAVEVIRAKNGFEARTLEKAISTDLHISQTIRKTTKARKLNFDLSKSIPSFRAIVDDVLDYVEKSGFEGVDSEFLLKENELTSYYGNIPSLQSNPIFNEVEKTLQITGQIIGVKGKLMVTKANNSIYVTNLSRIIGHRVSFSKKPLKIKGQQSLSDFF